MNELIGKKILVNVDAVDFNDTRILHYSWVGKILDVRFGNDGWVLLVLDSNNRLGSINLNNENLSVELDKEEIK